MAEPARSPAAVPVKLVRPEGDFESDKFSEVSPYPDFWAFCAWILGIVGMCMMLCPIWWIEARKADGYCAVPLFGINFWFAYIYEAYSNRSWAYLMNVMGETKLVEFSKKLQAARPSVHFHMQNYYIGLQNQRMNTTRHTHAWHAAEYKDGTLPLEKVIPRDPKDTGRKYFMCEFKMDFLIEKATRDQMRAEQTEFLTDKYVDQFQDNNMEYVIEGVPEYSRYKLVVLDPKDPDACTIPFLFTKLAFVLSVIFVLTVPHRFFVFTAAPKVDWRVSKYLLCAKQEAKPQAEPEPKDQPAEKEPEDEDMPVAEGGEGGGREGELRQRK